MTLRVVIGLESLTGAGGTSYAMTVARELQRLGHEPILSAAELGPMADHVERDASRSPAGEAELPGGCDAVLANDAIAGATLARATRRRAWSTSRTPTCTTTSCRCSRTASSTRSS